MMERDTYPGPDQTDGVCAGEVVLASQDGPLDNGPPRTSKSAEPFARYPAVLNRTPTCRSVRSEKCVLSPGIGWVCAISSRNLSGT